jgi:DNA sulfur modification protein DndC
MVLPTIPELIARGALFVINHSAGKDSQAMTIRLRELVPPDQLVIVHAELPEVDWDGLEEHIRATAAGLPLYLCRSRTKTFLSMVERRGMFPSPNNRQCTSDLKRGPIERTIRAIAKERGIKIIVNCVGIRAQESDSRSKASPFRFSENNSKAGREWYEWLPIFDMTLDEVWATIRAAGQEPHWAYAEGMSRLSCVFCIMANRSDLLTAARLKPELARRYAQLERRINQTMLMPAKGGRRIFLDELLAPIATMAAEG